MSRRKRFKRIFKLGLCGDWVEIYKITPPPKTEGEFFLAFREKRKRKVLPLFCGITIGGVEALIKDFKQRHVDLTKLLLFIMDRFQNRERFPLEPLIRA
ncbi:hypothetical protein AMJ47_02325 [Parcubacteria bacterium DG_72]|nr:MAG: hypothetical protein AMJ47_02325 [Parcubacteria bacterium DG_72]